MRAWYLGDQVVSYPSWQVLKKAIAKAEAEEKGVKIESFGQVLCEISKIQKWKEYYGQFAVQESEETIIIFLASDILFIDNRGASLVLHLKSVHRPPRVG